MEIAGLVENVMLSNDMESNRLRYSGKSIFFVYFY